MMSFRRGLTLVELLVAVAIIGLLSALIFPVFARARESARQTTCVSNLRQLGKAVLMYGQDYDDRMPSIWNGEWNQRAARQLNWAAAILPYVRERSIYRCPSDTMQDIASSYIGNLWLHNRAGSGIQSASECVLLMDGYTGEGPEYCDTEKYFEDEPYSTQFSVYGLNADYTIWNLASRPTRGDKGLPRHYNRNEMVFVDTHVKPTPPLKSWDEPGAFQALETEMPFTKFFYQTGGAWVNR